MLEVRKIYKTYEGKPLLCSVSLRVEPGETVCLLGPSGSGKSTLLRIIAGLEDADAGQVLWDGQDLSSVPVHRRGFGLMFQDYALFPHRSVAENVGFGLRMQGMRRAEIDRLVRAALDQVNLGEFENRRVTDLSGGEQQRVALARALAPRPRLLMLDEPLGALDRALREELVDELRELLHETGIPAVYVTHDQGEAFALADRLALLSEGRVEQEGRPEEVFRQPGSPWVAQFLGLTNLLPGVVTTADPATVQTEAGVFRGQWMSATPAVAGAPAVALLRAGEPVSEPRAAENVLSGVVEDSAFRGGHFHTRVRTAAGRRLAFETDLALTRGEPAYFSAPAERVQIWPEELSD